ncbi:hypothetical protein JD844_005036 [Phrynosoma platyrhinos]|uniref:proteasome endopeptidase complex n=1 Tax=Phrynosoma platyrhinos TaxID=52577 RepID=A0ABQ7SE45_PHRPL|nr:hypothetical protein JD844_005036 [Phrynosoma platyrhinos]
MASLSVLQAPSQASLRGEGGGEGEGGFSFHNCARNAHLEAEGAKKGLRLPTARKTGTTIAGVVFKDGIVLGADTRATEGMVVADKNCSKIHYISPNIYCCGAGTAADTEMTTQLISSNMELHSLSTGRLPRVVTANRMLKQMLFRYQGYIGAALVLGGVDVTGAHLYSIYPHGSTDKLPYVTMGSGSLAAMAVFEDKFKPDMELSRVPDFQVCTNVSQACLAFQGLRFDEIILEPSSTVTHDDDDDEIITAEAVSEGRPALHIWVGKYLNVCLEFFSQEEEAKQLVREAIAAGIFNDLGSGSNIDLCVLSKNKLDFLRPYDTPNKKGERQGRYRCEKGTTGVLTEKVTLLDLEVTDETVQTMDTS